MLVLALWLVFIFEYVTMFCMFDYLTLVCLVGWLEFNVPFQHKYGYTRDDLTLVSHWA